MKKQLSVIVGALAILAHQMHILKQIGAHVLVPV